MSSTVRSQPKVISSVQIAPPSFEKKRSGRNLNQAGTKLSEEVWTNVRRRGVAKTKQVKLDSAPSTPRQARKQSTGSDKLMISGPADSKPSVVTRKPPKTAAVMITGNSENFSYAEALNKTRGHLFEKSENRKDQS
ncbi:hypothetical protein RF55_4449 [Lasius niger]|uniref:Uncharacterized protein n=1 Tax=Lasius niger TaxID=67767 RepID=A0A0J7KYG4_LASNI|nr:hypothetical protein RF55_4449 [Lasius niger]